jgi:hypothetical protein
MIRVFDENKYAVGLIFDLASPIEKQTDEAKLILMDRRELVSSMADINNFQKKKNASKPKNNAFIAFIRILDALASGVVSPKLIASIIYEGKEEGDDNASKSKKRAVKWRDYDYIKLIK